MQDKIIILRQVKKKKNLRKRGITEIFEKDSNKAKSHSPTKIRGD